MTKKKEMTIARVFDAPVDKVWRAWTEQESVKQWLAPEGFTIPVYEIDFEARKMKTTMRGPDGTDYMMTGVITEAIANKKFAAVQQGFFNEKGEPAFEVINTATFEQVAPRKTKVRVHAEVQKADKGTEMAVNGMQEGWNQSLNKLEKLLKKG